MADDWRPFQRAMKAQGTHVAVAETDYKSPSRRWISVATDDRGRCRRSYARTEQQAMDAAKGHAIDLSAKRR